MNPLLVRALPIVALLLPLPSLLDAQEAKERATATIEVTDGNGAVIPNAQAEIISEADASSETLATDIEGRVKLELEPGSYDVIVTSIGFKTLNRRFTVNAGTSQKLELALQVGG